MKIVAAVVFVAACGGAGRSPEDPALARERMVRDQIEARGVKDARTLAALRKVERHLFVPPETAALAYADHPLPIGDGQTISQPYVVALMSEAIGLRGGEKVLEIGTGSGYQAAVLAEMGARVYTMEIVPRLARGARATLARLGYRAVEVREGNGWAGWPEEAPFDAIVVTAAPPTIPDALKRQLRDGGRLVIPVGRDKQELMLVTRTGDAFEEKRLLPVRFVPLVAGPASATTTVAELYAAYRALPENPESREAPDRIRAQMIEAARPLVQLRQAERGFDADHVDFCPPGLAAQQWRCSPTLLGYADDAVHLPEFAPYTIVVLEPRFPVRLVSRTGAPLKAALLGHDGAVERVHVAADGTLDLRAADLRRPRVLAAFFAEPSVGLRKHLWVIQRPPGAGP
jgi:protein-L-isoaspartate(D-aspartate) O-methyltransferase